jgi:hypothetical protein
LREKGIVPGNRGDAVCRSSQNLFRHAVKANVRYHKLIALALCSLMFCGFGWFRKKDKTIHVKADPTQILQNGYALLYKLMGDEKDVSKLLIIKKETSELHNLIKAISERAKSAHESLNALARTGLALNLQNDGLPEAETATRQSISKLKARQLLGAKGPELELLLLLSQNEALAYGQNLAGVLAASETDQKRKYFLDALSSDLGALQDRVLKMLMEHYH